MTVPEVREGTGINCIIYVKSQNKCSITCGPTRLLEGGGRVVKVLGFGAEGSEFKPATATKFLGSFSDDGCLRGLKISVDCPARKEQVRAMPSGNSS